LTHPLHYVFDVQFDGRLSKGADILLVDVLIEAGADLNFQRDRDDGRKSDTPLIGAASLGAEDAGIRLLDAGAKPELRGLFGETALHWAAMLGEDRLTARLLEKPAPDLLDLKDEKYNSSPLGWAIHGCSKPPAGNHGRQREVIILLVAAGAIVGPGLVDSDAVRTNPTLLAALQPAKP
jgi:ankyrin repeat protein